MRTIRRELLQTLQKEAKLSDREVARSLPYFQERLKPKLAFQIVGDAPNDYLSERGPDLYVVSASRFLSSLV